MYKNKKIHTYINFVYVYTTNFVYTWCFFCFQFFKYAYFTYVPPITTTRTAYYLYYYFYTSSSTTTQLLLLYCY